MKKTETNFAELSGDKLTVEQELLVPRGAGNVQGDDQDGVPNYHDGVPNYQDGVPNYQDGVPNYHDGGLDDCLAVDYGGGRFCGAI